MKELEETYKNVERQMNSLQYPDLNLPNIMYIGNPNLMAIET